MCGMPRRARVLLYGAVHPQVRLPRVLEVVSPRDRVPGVSARDTRVHGGRGIGGAVMIRPLARACHAAAYMLVKSFAYKQNVRQVVGTSPRDTRAHGGGGIGGVVMRKDNLLGLRRRLFARKSRLQPICS